ncbi:unnamed protein product [Vicia faba]|uniref:Uncharacterized protein n=1 Tax=Vicia faba TaxID=3906 RepID=A0AAV0ZBN8_VICFA|nr:unnamed protein product [Vicia faba]
MQPRHHKQKQQNQNNNANVKEAEAEAEIESKKRRIPCGDTGGRQASRQNSTPSIRDLGKVKGAMVATEMLVGIYVREEEERKRSEFRQKRRRRRKEKVIVTLPNHDPFL